MIEIVKDPSSDCRPVNGKVSINKLQLATANHIDDVAKGLDFFSGMLKEAGKRHDRTKITDMPNFHEALQSGNIKKSDWYKMHIAEERHHLQSKVPKDITLIDVLEYISDCIMAGSARSGDIYDIMLADPTLQRAFANTVELLKKQIKVVE